ncbi:SEC-C metal-binding domain-containing protein [Aliiglaciecola sp. LCG003]|uniref:YecA family protein n=1 Tax=Aliiglaciecola sp. LCG003 TaxID=3053655 RepID=UPI0025747594|nr:SEC-C metal-binding domain-containing protein [Aliiglaciecola sp. LCG003]WJG09408.1 SEC-C metal-binding domain-containing protein [Aliiglaciecola sp. LCG003]
MKIGRNDPCPCGSGKKYKGCCMDQVSKQHAEIADDIQQSVLMNPNLDIDQLNVIAQHKMAQRNNHPNEDFCGLTPTQMANWLYAPLNELAWVKINTPDDLSSSPVMRYLALILDEALQSGGSFKATSKGNLPAKLVKQASALLDEFAVAQYQTVPSISEYSGSNEDKLNGLHYTRVLAQLSGILYVKSGRFHMKKAAQKQYQAQGISAFFLPMLEAAVAKYNWGYLDGWSEDIDLQTFWLFMLWRVQSHGSIDQLIDEMCIAFPDLLLQFPKGEYSTPSEQLGYRIEARFIKRFLEFWGFIIVNPRRVLDNKPLPRKADIQPLLVQTFEFHF